MRNYKQNNGIVKYTVRMASTENDMREGNPPRDNFVSYSLSLDNAIETSAWQQAVSTANRYEGDIYSVSENGDEQMLRSYRNGISVKKLARV